MSAVIVRTFEAPSFCEKEALRYAGCKEKHEETLRLLAECLKEAQDRLSYRVCYRELPLQISGSICDFGAFSVESGKLAANLAGCGECLIFAATIGVEMDRLIARYGRIAPAKALLFQAIGAERIEALCDAFVKSYALETGAGLKPRFSPGYGDVPLTVQKDVFSVLDCAGKISLSLNDSMLLSPSKSVTAFAGITKETDAKAHDKCSLCENKNCAFRSKL